MTKLIIYSRDCVDSPSIDHPFILKHNGVHQLVMSITTWQLIKAVFTRRIESDKNTSWDFCA
jgi:hypothetical protein